MLLSHGNLVLYRSSIRDPATERDSHLAHPGRWHHSAQGVRHSVLQAQTAAGRIVPLLLPD